MLQSFTLIFQRIGAPRLNAYDWTRKYKSHVPRFKRFLCVVGLQHPDSTSTSFTLTTQDSGMALVEDQARKELVELFHGAVNDHADVMAECKDTNDESDWAKIDRVLQVYPFFVPITYHHLHYITSMRHSSYRDLLVFVPSCPP